MNGPLYTPLNAQQKEIRVLEIQPGQFEDEIRCSFSTLSLLDDPPSIPYNALSYVWGDQMAPNPILVAGHPVTVTQNLEDAVRHLRRPDGPLVIWIDAVCINQADIEHRNQQVALMGELYRKASHVYAWVGLADSETKGVMQLAQLFGQSDGRDSRSTSNSSARCGVHSLHWDPSWAPALAAAPADVVARAHLRALVHFAQRPWWTRVWTVQEAVLPAHLTLVCGPHRVDVDDLFRTSASFMHHLKRDCCQQFLFMLDPVDVDLSSGLVRVMKSLAVLEQARSDATTAVATLGKNMVCFRLRNCSVPKDKIYGMLGFGVSTTVPPLRPDYAASDQAVYEQAAVAMLEGSPEGLLQMLVYVVPEQFPCHHGNSDAPLSDPLSSVPGLPSWVPDWTLRIDYHSTENALVFRLMMYYYHRATATRPRFIAYDRQRRPGKLTLRGVIFGTVGTVGPSRDSRNSRYLDLDVYDSHVRAWKRLAGTDADQRPDRLYRHTQETVYDAFWQTLCSGMAATSPQAVDNSDYLHIRDLDPQSRAEAREAYEAVCTWFSSVGGTQPDERELAMKQLMGLTTYSRRLFLSVSPSLPEENRGGDEDRWMGLAPLGAQPGDRIAVLYGSRVPYILRQHGATENHEWLYVGDAYVHGAMNGEALNLGKEEDITLV